MFKGCEDSDDFSPDPKDCTKFYRCSHGYQFTFKCGPGTGFDPKLKLCNFKDSIPSCSEDESSSGSSGASGASDSSNGSTAKTSNGGSNGSTQSTRTSTTTTSTTTTTTTTASTTLTGNASY